ncbi:MAG: hypothetical protein E7264_02730 [Lachnospiraceae bacterium]|nr:hypothetical protein [Lachnospiraceae bacterium]
MKQFVFYVFCIFILLVFHQETIAGTKNGLLLWYQTLIPSLLPFILVTNALSETHSYHAITRYFQNKKNNSIFELIAIVLGNICGYPIGAKIINDFVTYKFITNDRANQIISLSSQSSPMFLLGYVYSNILHIEIPLSVFLLSIYVPVFIYFLLLKSHSSNMNSHNTVCIPHSLNLKETFTHTVEIMVSIGFYVIIFSIALSVLVPITHNNFLKVMLSLLEITNGLNLLSITQLQYTLKIPLICMLCSFGGVCSMFQVKSVLTYPGINMKKYLADKCILSAGTFFIVYLYLTYINTFFPS